MHIESICRPLSEHLNQSSMSRTCNRGIRQLLHPMDYDDPLDLQLRLEPTRSPGDSDINRTVVSPIVWSTASSKRLKTQAEFPGNVPFRQQPQLIQQLRSRRFRNVLATPSSQPSAARIPCQESPRRTLGSQFLLPKASISQRFCSKVLKTARVT